MDQSAEIGDERSAITRSLSMISQESGEAVDCLDIPIQRRRKSGNDLRNVVQ
jgi:hypothetical protein